MGTSKTSNSKMYDLRKVNQKRMLTAEAVNEEDSVKMAENNNSRTKSRYRQIIKQPVSRLVARA